uniref:Peptidase n=1 Tax=Pseudomonas phage HRDY3 TaxID=3236930 RepID=A0AB39CEE6_9VIRU
MPPTVDVMGSGETTRTPEEQALYEQYLKKAGGDPRGVPESVSNPGKNPFGNPELQRTNPGAGTPTWSQRNAGRGGNGVPGAGGGYTSGQYGQRARPWSQTQTGRAITGAATKIGNVYGYGSFGTMAPGVFGGLRKVDGKVNDVLNKVPGLRELSRLPGIPQIPRLSNGLPSFGNIVTGVADKAAGLFGGNDAPVTVPANERPRIMNGQRVTYDGPAVTSTDQIGTTSVNAPVAAMSPASPTYYNNDAPVVTRSAGAPVNTMAATQATAMPVTEKVERNTFDGVQKVAISSSDVPMGGGEAAPAAPGAPGAGSGGAKNDMPSIDDVPAIMDEYGLLFVNFGMV